jgi:branched-chain amino acid transport system ATP-binding protein
VLTVQGLRSGYGHGLVLFDIDLTVEPGSIVAVLGRNGAGKTTLLHTIQGLIRPTAGSVTWEGRELVGLPSHKVARAGVALVPQGRRVFAPLSVEDNLRVRVSSGAWTTDRIWELFPSLAARRAIRAGALSGGEQQMLALARALLTSPQLLLMDEPSEGLAPAVVDHLSDIILELRQTGLAVVLVEQNLGVALDIADRVAVMVRGRMMHRSTPDELRADPVLVNQLLGAA